MLRNLILLCGLIALAGCHSQPAQQLHPKSDTHPTVHNHELADKETLPDSMASEIGTTAEAAPVWSQIETHTIAVTPEAQPWIFNATGLSFQMVDALPDPNMKLFKPIGDAQLMDDGRVLMSFPDHNVVAWFVPEQQYQAKLYGSVDFGGSGESVNQPSKVAVAQKWLWLLETSQKVIAHFDHELKLEHVIQPSISDFEHTVLFPSRDGNFIMTSLRKPTLFYKITPHRQLVGHYSLPNRDGAVEANMPQLTTYEDGTITGIRAGGHNAFHLDQDGKIIRQFDFDFSAINIEYVWEHGFRGCAAAYLNPTYYFLFKDTKGENSYLLRITETGQVVNFSPVPFPADGMSVTANGLLLFERATGKAQMYSVK